MLALYASMCGENVSKNTITLPYGNAAAAYAAVGRARKGSTGRHRAAIEAASRLRFQTVEAGSVVEVLPTS